MRITASAQDIFDAIERRTAKVVADITTAEIRANELQAQAETSESAKKALHVVRAAIDRAKKVRDSLASMEKAIRGLSNDAKVELNENECAVFGYVPID